MKNRIRHITHHSLLITIACIMLTLGLSLTAMAAVRPTDVNTASPGNVIVNIPGEFAYADIAAILNQVNSYRREACQNGYPNPNQPSAALTSADYSEVRWSGDLEWIAQTRAAEGAVLQDHTRPNGTLCFSVDRNGVYSNSETLAWNYGSLLGGITQWYGEKSAWIRQDPYAVTGHYESMIDPDLKYIGIGCFTSNSGEWSCVAGAYSYADSLSSVPQGFYGSCLQAMEVPASSVSMQGPSSVAIGKTASYASLSVSLPGIVDDMIVTPALPSGTPTFTSSDTAVATITPDGLLSARSTGTTIITMSCPDGSILQQSVTVTKPVRGTTFNSDGADYRITDAAGTVAYVRRTAGGSSIVIPDTVSFSGFSYAVTSIADNAFKNNKALRSIQIGSNVITIGKNAFSGCSALKSITIPVNVASIGQKAFYNCKKLKKLTIQSAKLKSSKVGSKAFARTGIRKVKVPKARKKAYKKWIYRKGIARSAKIK